MKEATPAQLPRTAGGIIDSHAHVVTEYFKEDQEEVIDRAFASGVCQMVNPAVTVADFEELKELTKRYANLYIAVGQHPHEAKDWSQALAARLRASLKEEKVVAVGECGLDFYYNHSDRDQQLRAFREQVQIARDCQKPVIVHCRDAWQEAIEILKEERDERLKGVFHCFTGSPAIMPLVEELDFYVSFSGIVTFQNARDIQACARLVRQDRMLVETDCPFLAPQKMRGKRNEPSYVWWVAEKLAELRGEPLEQIADHCAANARRLFDLPELSL
ncbi:MAG: TatD family hydrolase [Candidatus Obscuribacterales bacterium]